MDLFFYWIALLAVLSSIFKKKLLSDFSNAEYYIISSMIFGVLALGLYYYKKNIQHEEIDVIGKMTKPNTAFVLLFLLCTLRMYIGFTKLDYLKGNDFSKYKPLYKSVTMVFSFALGILLLKEGRSKKHWMGLACVIGGIFLINGD